MRIFFAANEMIGAFFILTPFFYLFTMLAVFVLLIIGCVKVYNESKELDS